MLTDSKHREVQGYLDPYVVDGCEGIAWDRCHKIYIMRDRVALERIIEWGSYTVVDADDANGEVMYNTLVKWWQESCELRFIQAMEADDYGKMTFDTQIEQGSNWR